MFIVLSSCLLYPILVIIYNKYIEIKYTKILNVLNQYVNVTKRVRFATFAESIVDNFFLLTAVVKLEHNQNTIAAINQRAIRIKFHDHSRFFHQSLQKLAVVERLF